jgi:hypothetical protein
MVLFVFYERSMEVVAAVVLVVSVHFLFVVILLMIYYSDSLHTEDVVKVLKSVVVRLGDLIDDEVVPAH